MTDQDVPIDWILTPERAIDADSADDKPAGIEWAALDDERVAEIPILQSMRD